MSQHLMGTTTAPRISTSKQVVWPFRIAWAAALLFYVLEYATRSAPAVMIPSLTTAFARDAVGVSAILGAYYYTYSVTSLIAGLALDRLGAKYAVSFGAALLGVGCLVFTIASSVDGYTGRLMQGAGSSFAFTGAVYLASRGFPARFLATAIGVTQCMGMLGGSAGQFLVGPLLSNGLPWRDFWYFFGAVGLGLAVLLVLITPANDHANAGEPHSLTNLLNPYKTVFSNPQSYLCGLVAGLMFAPTTIGALTWGVALFQHDTNLDFRHAVTLVSLVPLGWVVGCPLMGWLADRIGLRKPVLFLGGGIAIIATAQVMIFPQLAPPAFGLFILGIASGAAMIPYSIIKEANPDEVKGSATGAINFLNFGISALLGPVFANLIGRSLATTKFPLQHLEYTGLFWIACILLAMLASLLLHETGHGRKT